MSSEYGNRDSSPVRRVRERYPQTGRGLRVTFSGPTVEVGPPATSRVSQTLSVLGHLLVFSTRRLTYVRRRQSTLVDDFTSRKTCSHGYRRNASDAAVIDTLDLRP